MLVLAMALGAAAQDMTFAELEEQQRRETLKAVLFWVGAAGLFLGLLGLVIRSAVRSAKGK